MSTPPSASTTDWKPARSTNSEWLIRSPVIDVIVRATSCAPPPSIPPSNAALILLNPWPGMSTHRSRGKERNTAFFSPGSTCTTMMVSERKTPPMCWSVPKTCCSSLVNPARLSLPSSK